MFDFIIRGGTVIDGSGKERYSADVGIKGDRVTAIKNLSGARAVLTIDAKGKYVTPGFVDVNNHSDTYWQIFHEPKLRSLAHQGITTIIGGGCGSSLAPLFNPNAIKSIQKWANIQKVSVEWESMKEYFETLLRKGLYLNYGTLVGHATLRRTFVGDDVRAMNRTEIRSGVHMLKEALHEGALGMSTGLVYTHARLASKNEVAAFTKAVGSQKKIYATHLRDESFGLVQSVKEAITSASAQKVRTHISHLKAVGEENWDKYDEVLELITNARKNGVDITFDVFPYTFTSSVLYTFLPQWATESGKQRLLANLRDKDKRREILLEMKEHPVDFSKIRIAVSLLDKSLNQKDVGEIAKDQDKEPEEVILDALLASEGRVVANMHVLSEENIEKAIRHPHSIIASDGVGYDREHRFTGESVHPRNFGAMIRVLQRYVTEKRIISWEEAIEKMTNRPAVRFGVGERGLIKSGFYADINVINPDALDEVSTINQPYQYACGIEEQFLNGKSVIRGGCYAGGEYGQLVVK